MAKRSCACIQQHTHTEQQEQCQKRKWHSVQCSSAECGVWSHFGVVASSSYLVPLRRERRDLSLQIAYHEIERLRQMLLIRRRLLPRLRQLRFQLGDPYRQLLLALRKGLHRRAQLQALFGQLPLIVDERLYVVLELLDALRIRTAPL